MNALSTVQFAMPTTGLAVLSIARLVKQLKWRAAMIRAVFGQEGFR